MIRSTIFAVAIFSLSLGPCDAYLKKLGPAGSATADSSSSSSTQTTAATSPEDQLMNEATQLCLAGDCQSAHDRLAIGLPANSPVRQSAAFKDLENRWATATVNGAADDPDVMARRKELADVIASPAVDPGIKNRATTTLASLPTKAAPDPTNPPVVDAGKAPDTKKGKKQKH